MLITNFKKQYYVMSDPDKIDIERECGVCGNKITEYFDKTYNGKRGICSKCNNNFPLE